MVDVIGSPGFEEEMGFTRTHTTTLLRSALAFVLVTGMLTIGSAGGTSPAYAASIDCSRGVNLSFEDPDITLPPTSTSTWAMVNAPGWQTTDTGIEIWRSGFLGAVAPDGNQLSELQGNNNDPRWQDIPTFEGDQIAWSFFHRGRKNRDRVIVRIGSPSVQTVEGSFRTGTAAFVQYSGTYAVPAGQTTTRFVLDPRDLGSSGNLVDDVRLELVCEITVAPAFGDWTDTDGSGTVTAGDQYALEYVVANDGTATLASISVTEVLGDAVSCPVATLMPGESTTCTAVHTVAQAEIDAGSITSGATAQGTDAAGVTIVDTAGASQGVEQLPTLELAKSGTLDASVVETSSRPDAGDAIAYSFDVTNTGNVTLSSVTVVDPVVGAVTCPAGGLAPGGTVSCSADYTVTQADVDAGEVVNTAEASAKPPTGDAVTASSTVTQILEQSPSVELIKSGSLDSSVVSPASRPDAGDVVNYGFDVTNTGNVTLSSITVTDPLVGAVTCAAGDLAPGATIACSAGPYAISQADVDAGEVVNTAEASGTPPMGEAVTGSDGVTVILSQEPSLSVAKSTTAAPYDTVGQVISYDIIVSNTGNATLSDVTVTDSAADAGSVVCGRSTPAMLAPGSALTCTANRTVSQADLDDGSVVNTASAAGTDPTGGAVGDDSDAVTVDADQQPEARTVKTGVAETLGDGTFRVQYDVTVENIGNVTLTGVTIEDDLNATFGGYTFDVESASSADLTVNPAFDGSAVTTVTGPDVLAPGDSGTVTLTVVVQSPGDAGPFTNVAAVYGAEFGTAVADTAKTSTALDVGFDLAQTMSAPSAVGVGDQVTWTLHVENAGPSLAPGPITVTDDLGEGLVFVGASGPGWMCSNSAGTVSCEHPGGLSAGESATITLVTANEAVAGATLTNIATAAPAEPANEVDLSNNVAGASVRVDALPSTGTETQPLLTTGLVLFLFGLALLAVSRRGRWTNTK